MRRYFRYIYLMNLQDFQAAIRAKLSEQQINKHRAALNADLPQDAIRSVLDGHMPKLDRAAKIAEALNLEFYIGPFRQPENLNNSGSYSDFQVTKPTATYAYDPEIDNAEYVLVPKLDIQAAAGHGKAVDDERPVGLLAFRREWLRRHAIQPGLVSAVEIAGDSMEPGLSDGDTILIDHRRNQVRRGAVVAARVGGDLFVKRLEQTPTEDWLLTSDNHAYAPLALTADDAVIGEVVWRGRWLG